jgi:hypothetical protein
MRLCGLGVGKGDNNSDQIKFRLSDCVFEYGDFRDMDRLDGTGLQEVPKEARSLTSRAACCQSAIRRVESPLCRSHARQGLTSRHGSLPNG